MNSSERVKAALRRQKPDRVPILEFVMDPKVAAAAAPGCRDVADCMDRLGLDGVACGKLLPHGTPQEVREAVCQAIAEGTGGGPFILSSSNSIHSSCNPANVLAMLAAAREYGALS